LPGKTMKKFRKWGEGWGDYTRELVRRRVLQNEVTLSGGVERGHEAEKGDLDHSVSQTRTLIAGRIGEKETTCHTGGTSKERGGCGGGARQFTALKCIVGREGIQKTTVLLRCEERRGENESWKGRREGRHAVGRSI